MTVVYDRFGVTVHAGDCLDVLATLPDASVHAVVTDPPYGLGFMGKVWDSGKSFVERHPERSNSFDHVGGIHNPVDSVDAARTRRVEGQRFGRWCSLWVAETLRVLKPGGHLLAFGGSRTWHRLTVAIEDAGFEIRDSIAWLYASGFPKSLDVSKAITATERHGGANSVSLRRARMGDDYSPSGQQGNRDGIGHRGESGMALGDDPERYRPTDLTPAALVWQGWGTALKPAFEPIVVARKPLDGTVAANVLEHGAGALNIDGCRIGTGEDRSTGGATGKRVDRSAGYMGAWADAESGRARPEGGRWPSNVVFTHAATPDGVDLCGDGCVVGCPVRQVDEQGGVSVSQGGSRGAGAAGYAGGVLGAQPDFKPGYGDTGGASRFFPVFRFEAKAAAAERPRVDGVAHPTVKPLALMRWLVRLVTPPGGVVLDPFLGSGTTAQAARAEGFQCVGVEREESYLPLIHERLDGGHGDLFDHTGGVA